MHFAFVIGSDIPETLIATRQHFASVMGTVSIQPIICVPHCPSQSAILGRELSVLAVDLVRKFGAFGLTRRGDSPYIPL